MSEQYFLVRKLGLGKEVVSLSLVVTEVSRGGGMRKPNVGPTTQKLEWRSRRLPPGVIISSTMTTSSVEIFNFLARDGRRLRMKSQRSVASSEQTAAASRTTSHRRTVCRRFNAVHGRRHAYVKSTESLTAHQPVIIHSPPVAASQLIPTTRSSVC